MLRLPKIEFLQLALERFLLFLHFLSPAFEVLGMFKDFP